MSSRDSRQQGEPQGTANISRNSRPSLNGSSTRNRTSTGSSNNSSIRGRSARQSRSVHTLIDGRTPSSSSTGDVMHRGSRGEPVPRIRPQARRWTGRGVLEVHPFISPHQLAGRSPFDTARTRDDGMIASMQSRQTAYIRHPLTMRTSNTSPRSRPITSRSTGIHGRINQALSSSSDDGQSDPATYFTLLEMETSKNIMSTASVQQGSNQSLHLLPSESKYAAHQLTEFKETINKLDQVPDWFPHSDGFPPNPPVTPKIAESSSRIKIESVTQKRQRAASNESTIHMPQKTLNPQELMKKLKEISENRRTYYVQNTGSKESLLGTFYDSPHRQSIGSTLSLPMNVGKDVTPSTRALSGSMTTHKFIELSKRKPGSVFRNAHQPTGEDDLNVPRVKKCETLVPPVDMYKDDMIINVPIYPLFPVEPHETVDAPSVEAVMMINRICDEVDAIFKDIHIGFHASQEQIEGEEAKQQERTLAQGTESNDQIVMELRASFFPHSQTGSRTTDSKRSVQSIGDWQSNECSLGEESLASLPPEPPMSTGELIDVLNQKYEPIIDSGSSSGTHYNAYKSEHDIKIIYSSDSAHTVRQVSENEIGPSTLTDADSGTSAMRFDEPNSTQNSSRRSSIYKGGLRRFTAKVQIPTLSDLSLQGESMEKNISEDEIQRDIQSVNSRESQRASMVYCPSKIREAERVALQELLHSGFGTMKLDTIYADPKDHIETKSQTELCRVLATYTDQQERQAATCDIFVGDPTLMVETGTTQQLMLYQGKFPRECDERSSTLGVHNTVKHKQKTIQNYGANPKEYEKINEQMDEQSDEECNDWVKFTQGSYEEEKGSGVEEEAAPEDNGNLGLVVDPEELRLLFPFAFRLSHNSSWWKRMRFSSHYRNPITKEKAPEFDDLRDQLKALLEEYEDHYTRFEMVYRWGDPSDPPKWNKKYRSPFFRPIIVDNQEPNRFHLSDDALSMKGSKEGTHSHNKPPGYSMATYFVQPTKWWNLANVRRYVIRKELAKHSLEHHRIRLGLRARPSKFSASLILGCRKRRSRKRGQVCRRNKDRNKALVEMFMKKNLPSSVWKELKTKYEVATSLRYRQRHHWNPFHPSNKPSIDGATRLGWYGQSLIRRSNITYLGQFAKGHDQQPRAQVKEIKERYSFRKIPKEYVWNHEEENVFMATAAEMSKDISAAPKRL